MDKSFSDCETLERFIKKDHMDRSLYVGVKFSNISMNKPGKNHD